MKYLSIKESAGYLGISRQMIHHLIKIKRLPARRILGRIKVRDEDLDKYYDSRWSRHRRFSEDEVGVSEAAKIIKITPLQFYYLIYSHKIPFTRLGCLYILKRKDVIECGKNIIRYRSKSNPKETKRIIGEKSIPEKRKFRGLFTSLPKEPALSRHA